MARIVYGIMGEGRGHATRSKTLLEDLKKRHEIILFGGGQAYNMLKDWDLPMEEIPFLKFGLGEGTGVQYWKTIEANFPTVTKMRPTIKKLASKIKKFQADIVISDFEPTVSRAAWRAGVRSVCIDNQHILTNCKGDFGRSVSRAMFHLGTLLWSHDDDFYLITNFFPLPVKRGYKDNTCVVPPIVRPEMLKMKPKDDGHFLVYQTYGGPEIITGKLYDVPYKFKAFPAKKHEKIKNVEYMPFGTGDFMELLRTCKGVITNGGHTLISEALFLGKPIISLPVKGQFEQELNARYLVKMGLGLAADIEKFDRAHFDKYMENFDTYKANIAKHNFCGNKLAIDAIEEQIKIALK